MHGRKSATHSRKFMYCIFMHGHAHRHASLAALTPSRATRRSSRLQVQRLLDARRRFAHALREPPGSVSRGWSSSSSAAAARALAFLTLSRPERFLLAALRFELAGIVHEDLSARAQHARISGGEAATTRATRVLFLGGRQQYRGRLAVNRGNACVPDHRIFGPWAATGPSRTGSRVRGAVRAKLECAGREGSARSPMGVDARRARKTLTWRGFACHRRAVCILDTVE